MRRGSARHRLPRLAALLAGAPLVTFMAVAAPGCGELRLADVRGTASGRTVLADSDLLVYRMSGGTLGQVWAVPLNSL